MRKELIKQQITLEDRIFTIRNIQVMLDYHLSELFNIETKRINEQVKRNLKRFPSNFMFQFSLDEWENLKSQNATAKRRTIPYAFTEQGVAMLSAVLNSEVAISVSIHIINTFIKLRQLFANNSLIEHRFNKIEIKQLEIDKNFERVFKALENNKTIPHEGVFYDGQIFDAWVFVSNLVKSAGKSLVLIDNCMDVLTLHLEFINNITNKTKKTL